MNKFDLKKCFECRDEAFISRFGRIPEMDQLERIMAGIKGSSGPLPYRKILEITKKKYWNFREYWLIPGRFTYNKQKKNTESLFNDIVENERQVIWVLFKIFKNIEVVSILLRFIDPLNYGIISPPVRYALRKQAQSNYADEYLEYLSTLRSLSNRYGFSRVADADLALWALVEKCLNKSNKSCENLISYQEEMIRQEEEFARKSQAYDELQNELINLYSERESLLQSEYEKKKKDEERGYYDRLKEKDNDIEKYRNKIKILEEEISDLQSVTIPIERIIYLPISQLKYSDKIIHDRRELPVDMGQTNFMKKMADIRYVNKIIWSENITSKQPNRIISVKDDGEITVLYVNKDNYAAKIKVFPVKCPDLTHARYFASILQKTLNIPIKKEEN